MKYRQHKHRSIDHPVSHHHQNSTTQASIDPSIDQSPNLTPPPKLDNTSIDRSITPSHHPYHHHHHHHHHQNSTTQASITPSHHPYHRLPRNVPSLPPGDADVQRPGGEAGALLLPRAVRQALRLRGEQAARRRAAVPCCLIIHMYTCVTILARPLALPCLVIHMYTCVTIYPAPPNRLLLTLQTSRR